MKIESHIARDSEKEPKQEGERAREKNVDTEFCSLNQSMQSTTFNYGVVNSFDSFIEQIHSKVLVICISAPFAI